MRGNGLLIPFYRLSLHYSLVLHSLYIFLIHSPNSLFAHVASDDAIKCMRYRIVRNVQVVCNFLSLLFALCDVNSINRRFRDEKWGLKIAEILRNLYVFSCLSLRSCISMRHIKKNEKKTSTKNIAQVVDTLQNEKKFHSKFLPKKISHENSESSF